MNKKFKGFTKEWLEKQAFGDIKCSTNAFEAKISQKGRKKMNDDAEKYLDKIMKKEHKKKYQNIKIIQIFSLEKNRFIDDYTFYNVHKNWLKIPEQTRTEIATKMNILRNLGFRVRLVSRRLTNEC